MKTTKLQPCSESKFCDIPHMKFYRSEKDLFYFDATSLLKDFPQQQELGIGHFFEVFCYLIAAIAERNGIAEDDLHLSDPAGKEYLEEGLAVPFLAYVDRSYGAYLIERMEELIRFGFSINDNMAKYFYRTRFEE